MTTKLILICFVFQGERGVKGNKGAYVSRLIYYEHIYLVAKEIAVVDFKKHHFLKLL